jgi:hypothetical protein
MKNDPATNRETHGNFFVPYGTKKLQGWNRRRFLRHTGLLTLITVGNRSGCPTNVICMERNKDAGSSRKLLRKSAKSADG